MLVEDSDTGSPSSITITLDRILICFSNLILRTKCEKTSEGETESTILTLVIVLSSFFSVKYFLKI